MREKNPRKCFHCLEVKPPEAFPITPKGRCRKVCLACAEREQAERDRRRREREAKTAARTWEQDGVVVRKCFRCAAVKPLEEGFAMNRRRKDGSAIRSYECKQCCSDRATEYKKWALRHVPGYRERHNHNNREWRQRNPEAAREASRRWQAKMNADPQWLARRNESRRLTYALRALADGRSVRRSPLQLAAGAPPRVPSRPLADAIERLIERERRANGGVDENDQCHAVVLQRLLVANGMTHEAAQRALYAWRHGEREQISIDTADMVLTAAGWLWWEVWNADTVRMYRWRFEVCRMRKKTKKETGKTYTHLTRTRLWHSGDLGPDYEELARIEALFTGQQVDTYEQVAA